jgi:hypothetical protein
LATLKQTEANRLNAQRSTGPTSSAGKAASSQNALKSGIDAQSQVIRGEDPDALIALTNQYLSDHQPQTAAERALVDILIDSDWLLRRLRKAEAQLWEYYLWEIGDWNRILADRNVQSQKPPARTDTSVGVAYGRAQLALTRLERRRELLQRSAHRALDDLRKAQASRADCPLPADPPAADPGCPQGPPAGPPAPSPQPSAPPATPSQQTPNPTIGFVPKIAVSTPRPQPKTLVPATPLPRPGELAPESPNGGGLR